MIEDGANRGKTWSGFWPAWVLGGGLRGQLSRSFLLIILISIGIMAVLARSITLPRLNDVALLLGRRQAFQLAPFFADAYARSGSWAAAPELVQRLSQPLPPELTQDITFGLPWRLDLIRDLAPDRVVLVGADGGVAADSLGLLAIGQPLPVELKPYRVPIRPQGKPIGWLVVTSDTVDELTEVLQATLRQTLLGAGLLAGSVALLLGFGLAQRLSQPIRNLSRAARALAAGDSYKPLPVGSHDEIGEMTLAFNQMASALATQQRLRQQMVADIAHELRTPLSVMQLDIEGLADGLQPPEEAAASLQDEITTLNRLVEDLRLLSLAEAGGLQFALAPLDAATFLHQLLAGWAVKAQAQQVKLRTEIMEPLPPIEADEGRLTQVFNNLLSNALRYTPTGQTITLGARLEGAEVVLWVSDSGPGITPEDLPLVFERFYRADRSRSRDTGGSGLGLAIAKQWVTLHGGRIWVESEPGHGATFYVALPIDFLSKGPSPAEVGAYHVSESFI
jgi:two-component system OmpR family sensor kinase/two-component system sensor histidine kinase BaeS